ncbi:ORF20 [Fusarium sp. NRRL 52700]|nr:ORF20 [Fusarium sp. NRRL 52700]
MRQIKYATTIPQIYDTTIIIGACRVIPRDDEGSGFDMGQCQWNDARMDQKRLAQPGRRQTWLSAESAEGFDPRVYQDVYKQAGVDGTLIKQYFTEEDVLYYRRSRISEMRNKYRHYELARWIRQCPKDTDGTTVIEDRISQFMEASPWDTRLELVKKGALLATAVHFRLSMAFLTDNMTAHFKLKRPMDETCLEWNMTRWLERRDSLTRPNKHFDLFKKEKEIETGAGLLWSGYTRFRLYLRAAHFETYLAGQEIEYTPESIERILEYIEFFFDLILNKVEKMASACKKIVDEAEQVDGGDAESRRTTQQLLDMTFDQCAVVPPRED